MKFKWHSYLSLISTNHKFMSTENEKNLKPKNCSFREMRKLAGSGNEKMISGSFVLFVVAFGFCHLLHQQIHPFNDQSFPYKFISEKQVCENHNQIVTFRYLIQRTEENLGK